MSLPVSLFPHDKEELLRCLERFDGEITAEDVTDSVKCDSSRYIHTSFIQVLLECICESIVKSDTKREILLTELCRQLSQSKLINEELLLHTLPLRKQLSKSFFDYVKKICFEVIPDSEFDFSTIAFLEENCTSFDNIYRTYFEELQEIGRGGFGVVCKARDKMTNTLYAVKKIFFNYKNDSRLRRVIREAKNISVLNHPNVVHYNNAWTEAPSPEEDFDYSSSEKDSSCNSSSGSCGSSKEYLHSEGVSTVKVEQKESFSSESTCCSRSIKSCHKQSSTQTKRKDTLVQEDSGSIIFCESVNSSYNNVAWSFGSNFENGGQNSSKSDSEKRDMLYSSDEVDSKKNCVLDSNCDSDSEKSDDSVNLNVKAILYIQMEYCDCDLRHWLDERARGNPLPFEMDIEDIFINILNGVEHIHSKCIYHRDLKPQNIFYSKSSNTLKIGDFGLATLAGCVEDVSNEGVSNLHSSSIGTLPYAAPEQIKGQSYDSKVDIYSLGIILIELLNNFSTAMEFYRGIDQIRKGNFPNEMKQSPKLMNLVKNLVNEKPEDRMSAKELLCYLHEDSKVTLQEREMAVQEKELFLNEKEILLREKEEFLLNEKEILLRETEAALREKDAALHEKDEEILRLRALVKELSLIK